jgi:hypothetical protein
LAFFEDDEGFDGGTDFPGLSAFRFRGDFDDLESPLPLLDLTAGRLWGLADAARRNGADAIGSEGGVRGEDKTRESQPARDATPRAATTCRASVERINHIKVFKLASLQWRRRGQNGAALLAATLLQSAVHPQPRQL